MHVHHYTSGNGRRAAHLGSSPPPFRLPGARPALQVLCAVLRRVLKLRPDLLHLECAECRVPAKRQDI